MTNEDINFVLPTEYSKLDNKNYTINECLYNFHFNVYVNTTNTIRLIEVYKNGELYNNIVLNNTSKNLYYIKDLDVLNKKNYYYKIRIILNDGKIYKNGFYLKIGNSNVDNDIKIIHFSTQGLHENFNHLNILLKIDTQYVIHSIKLYRKYLNKNWEYIANMTKATYGYLYKDLLFNVCMTQDSLVFYKVIITTANGLERTATLQVPIYTNTFSLNNIMYSGNPYIKKYSIYGGLVGTIIAPLLEFNNEIFEMIIDSANQKYLSIDIKNKKYRFYSENFKITYPDRFVFNQTDQEPNIFHIQGIGIINQIISEQLDIIKQDTCHFDMTIQCGDNYSIIFNIHVDTDNTLDVYTEKSFNNIVRYRDTYINVEKDFIDKTISNIKYDGILTYNDNLEFLKLDWVKQLITIDSSRIDNLFKDSDFITYNLNNFYFIKYFSNGINIMVFDGINYEELKYDIKLYEPTLEYIKHHICFNFDSNNKLEFHFINFDLTKNFEIINIKDNQINSVSINDSISTIFNDLKIRLLQQLTQIYSYNYNNQEYNAKFSNNYLLKEQLFESMNFDNFTQNIYMYIFKLAITTNAEVNGQEYKSELSLQATVNLGPETYDIEKIDYNYIIGDYISQNESYNQKPINIMEKCNDTFYIKFSSSLRTKNVDDYGRYKYCGIYNKNALIYNLHLDEVLDSDDFKYKDLCKTKIIQIDDSNILMFIFNNDKYIVNHLDIVNNELKKQFILNSKVSNQYLLSLNDEQLQQFSNILSIAKQSEFVERTMEIYSISDYNNIFIYTDKNEIFFDSINSSSLNSEYNAFVYKYDIQYPLNIKNKNAFLQELEIDTRKNT